MTATRQAFTSSGGGSTFAGVYDITQSPYNATTGATDNTAAIQAAITAAKATGGIVYVPPGVFKYASTLVCGQNTKGFSIAGVGGGVGDEAEPPSELRYTGSVSPGISCYSVFSFSLRNLRLTYDNAAFTGDLVDVDGGPHAADCTNWSIVGCGSLKAVAGTFTARSIVRLNKAINGIIQDCGFGGAVNTLREGDPGGSYVVGVRVTNCTFNHSTNAHIFVATGDGENLIWDNNRFEAGTNTTAIRGATVAVDGGDNLLYNPIIENNWFGDAGTSLIWIDNVSSFIAGLLAGNKFATAQGGVYCRLGGKWLVQTNSFENGPSAFDSTAPTSLYITSIANYYGTTRVFPAGWDPSAQSPREFMSINDQGTAAELAIGLNHLGPYVSVRANETFMGTTGLDDLTLGAQKNAGLTTLPSGKAAVYWGGNIGSPYNLGPVLALQAPHTTSFSGHVALMTGPTPAPVVHVESNGLLGFHGVAPVAQATRVGQLTDSTGGTVTTTLAAGITDAVAKNAIASLAAKVNALETLVHNKGLSA